MFSVFVQAYISFIPALKSPGKLWFSRAFSISAARLPSVFRREPAGFDLAPGTVKTGASEALDGRYRGTGAPKNYSALFLTGTCISDSHWLSSSLFQTPSI